MKIKSIGLITRPYSPPALRYEADVVLEDEGRHYQAQACMHDTTAAIDMAVNACVKKATAAMRKTVVGYVATLEGSSL